LKKILSIVCILCLFTILLGGDYISPYLGNAEPQEPSAESYNTFQLLDNNQTHTFYLQKPLSTTHLVRLDGPSWGTGWGCNCLMCIGNHLIEEHGILYNYLQKIGYTQWQTLHDNLHNSKEFINHLKSPKDTNPKSIFAPTPLDIIYAALKLVDTKQEDVVYDLGCGDGRVLILASSIFKCRSVGIDIDEVYVQQTKDNISINKLDKISKVYCGDILKVDFDKYPTVVFLYIFPDLSAKLWPKLTKLQPGTRIIVIDEPIPGVVFDIEKIIISKLDNKPHKIFIKTIRYYTEFL